VMLAPKIDMTLLCHSEFASVHFEHSGAWSSYHRCPP
jgi:hypothetical protein